MSQAEQAADDAGRGVVPGCHVQLSGEPAHVPVPRGGGPAGPRVELVRDGDVVAAIDVTCPCGQRFRLRCQY